MVKAHAIRVNAGGCARRQKAKGKNNAKIGQANESIAAAGL
jgi:hypothetical protein